MANCWPLFFSRVFIYEGGGERNRNTETWVSVRENKQKKTHFCACTKENPRTAQLFSTPSVGNNLIIQQINSPLFRGCLVDTEHFGDQGPRSSFLNVTVNLLVEVYDTMHGAWTAELMLQAFSQDRRGRGLSASFRPPLPLRLHTHRSCYHSENM